jgi:hypothetical protein
MKKNIFLLIFVALFLMINCYTYSYDVYAAPQSNVEQTLGPDGGGGSSTTTPSTNGDKPAWLSSSKVSCGPVGNIPAKVPEVFSLLILLLQIGVPIILVIYGMIDLSKGVMAQKEDEIKKGQQVFIKRIIAGALVFFIVALVKLLVGVVGGDSSNKTGIVSCINCFLNGECVTATNSGDGGEA